MNDDQNRIFYFMFGYHHPDGWEAWQDDKDFDYDTTGILPIRASDEGTAARWGHCIAKWYLLQLYADHPELKYNWSPYDYSTSVESAIPEGCEEIVNQLGEIEVDTYPEFSVIKSAFHD